MGPITATKGSLSLRWCSTESPPASHAVSPAWEQRLARSIMGARDGCGYMGAGMGRYVNPDNEGFARILRSEYVDKTGLVALFDSTLNSTRNLAMVSRP